MTAQLVDPLHDSDPVLLSRVRAGDADAYALLFERHRAAATAFAGGLAGHHQADDLVAEAFTRVFDALQRDLGPTVSFRSYLLTSIRSIFNNTLRRDRRYDLVDDYDALPPSPALTVLDDPEQRFDNQAVAEAYRSLPERWQAVLWYTAVEGLPHSEVALHLGIKPNAVAALSFRAREGLRQAYLSAHLRSTEGTACATWAPLLPAYARGNLDKRKQPGMRAHLDSCVTCTLALADLEDVNNRLGALLLPIVLGPGAIGLDRLWLGIASGTSTGATTGTVTTGKAGAAFLAGKTGIAVSVAASIVGAAVALPLLLAGLRSDERPRPPELGSQAVDSVVPFVEAPAAAEPGAARDPAVPDRTTPEPAEEPSASASPGAAPTDADPMPDPDRPMETPVGPVETPSEIPSEIPSEPSTPAELSPDLGIGQPTIGQVSLLGQALTSVTFPLTNVRTGSTVTVLVTNLVGFPLTWGNAGWHCPGAVGGLPGDVIRTETTITCTRTGAAQRQGELTLALLTSGTSEVTATVAQVAGVVDPTPGNDTVTLSIVE